MHDLRPTFLIGGAPRSGTTYLAQALARHPDICMAEPFIPEPKVMMRPEQTEGDYDARYATLFAHATATQQRGEKTSYYLESPEARQRIRAYLPNVKLLFIVREPVARAYSNYLWSRKNGLENLTFAEAIACEGQRPNPLPAEKAYARPFDYLNRGAYATLAEPYYSSFPRSQILFVLYEHIVTRNEELFHTIQKFLGIPKADTSLDVGVVNSAKEQGPEIEPSIVAVLRERLTPEVRRFATLTGLDLTAWGYNL